MSIKKSIGWCDITLNPIKGICKGGCWYYWTKPLYKRKFLQPEIRLDLDGFFKLPKSPKKIFLCSTHDIFGNWIPSWWRYAIFERIETYPQHTFQILTKFPQNIDGPMPNNCWLGTSITQKKELYPRIKPLYVAKAKLKFISFEPLLEDMSNFRFQGYLGKRLDWVIMGKLTGHKNKYDPKREWIERIVSYCQEEQIPIFMKDNLQDIWKDKLIQEFPKEVS